MSEIEELIKFYMEKYDAPYEVAEQWAIQDWHYMLTGPDL